MNKWWLEKPMRLIQTNLREIDAELDIDTYIKNLKEFSADVVLFNVGGIVANYPTKLEYHYKNPYLKDDFVGKVIKRVHAEGIKFIARFDFSKVNECYAALKPEWLYKGVKGESVNYNGQVHVCVNSEYQQEYLLKILGEVIDNYPVDGIFFNMAGYVKYDYSGNYHGICQCDNCRKRFKEMYGLDLPTDEDGNDPVYRQYVSFTDETNRELFTKIADFIKSKNENIAICNYGNDSGYFRGTDILRKESNTGIDRALPEWNYSASDNVKTVCGSWSNMAVSNSAVHFIDFPYRHSAVSPVLTAQRIAENIANGGWLDYYVIGHLDNQDDRVCFDLVKELFRFHKKNEKYYTGIRSLADVAIVMPERSSYFGSVKEYKGLFRILAGLHILFDVIHDSILDSDDIAGCLSKYKVVILPDTRNMSQEAIDAIDCYVNNGGMILATGASSMCDPQGNSSGKIRLKCAGIDSVKGIFKKERGTYLRIRERDKTVLNGFENLDIIYLDGDILDLEVSKEACSYLGYMPACMFGPPEKCYYTKETNKPGLVINNYGKGISAFIPWRPGMHYEKLGNHAHLKLISSVLDHLLGPNKSIYLDAPSVVEVTSHMQENGKWQLVNLVNLSGQIGTAFTDIIPVYDLPLDVKVTGKPQKILSLYGGEELDFKYYQEGYIKFSLPKLNLLETLVLML